MCAPEGNSEFCFPDSLAILFIYVRSRSERATIAHLLPWGNPRDTLHLFKAT